MKEKIDVSALKYLFYGLISILIAFSLIHLIYLSSLSGEPEIGEIQNVTMAPNDTQRISFTASNIEEMSYRTKLGNLRSFDVDLESDPSYRMTAATLPPYWQWNPPAKELEGELVLNLTSAEPGNYSMTLEAWNYPDGDHDHEGGATESFQVVVEE